MSTNTVIYEITSAWRPPFTEAVTWGSLMRKALMSAYGRLNGGATSPNLTGKASNGERLSNSHYHTHFVPQPDDGKRIGMFVVWSPSGFTREEQMAISAVKMLWTRWSERVCIEISFIGAGEESGNALFGGDRMWRSITPFVLPLHPRIRKGIWKKAPPDQQIARELRLRKMSEPVNVRKLNYTELDWRDFDLWRGNGNRFGYASGYEIQFSRSIRGPMLLGYGSHYGLGCFLPAGELL